MLWRKRAENLWLFWISTLWKWKLVTPGLTLSSAHPINQYDWDLGSSFDMKRQMKNSCCQSWSKALQFHTEWLLCRSEFAAHFSNNRPNWSASLEKIDYFLLCWIPAVIFLVFLLPLCLCPQRLCFLLCASPFEMVTFSFSGLCSLMLLCLLLESCYNHIYNHRIMCWDV